MVKKGSGLIFFYFVECLCSSRDNIGWVWELRVFVQHCIPDAACDELQLSQKERRSTFRIADENSITTTKAKPDSEHQGCAVQATFVGERDGAFGGGVI
jgi:hypothetical protein